MLEPVKHRIQESGDEGVRLAWLSKASECALSLLETSTGLAQMQSKWPGADLPGPLRSAVQRRPTLSKWEGSTLDGKHVLCIGPDDLQSQGT